MPFMTNSVCKTLAQTALHSNEFSAIVPVQPDGKIQPLCAFYKTKDCLPPLENLLVKNESVSVKNFLDCLKVRYINFLQSDSVARNPFSNVNTRQDYENLVKEMLTGN
jgi:molybdenum cofactor guanylyltransferase